MDSPRFRRQPSSPRPVPRSRALGCRNRGVAPPPSPPVDRRRLLVGRRNLGAASLVVPRGARVPGRLNRGLAPLPRPDRSGPDAPGWRRARKLAELVLTSPGVAAPPKALRPIRAARDGPPDHIPLAILPPPTTASRFRRLPSFSRVVRCLRVRPCWLSAEGPPDSEPPRSRVELPVTARPLLNAVPAMPRRLAIIPSRRRGAASRS